MMADLEKKGKWRERANCKFFNIENVQAECSIQQCLVDFINKDDRTSVDFALFGNAGMGSKTEGGEKRIGRTARALIVGLKCNPIFLPF